MYIKSKTIVQGRRARLISSVGVCSGVMIQAKFCLAVLLNPKIALFFLAFIPQFIDKDIGSYFWQFIFLELVAITSTLIIEVGLVSISERLTQFMRDNASLANFLERSVGLVLALFFFGDFKLFYFKLSTIHFGNKKMTYCFYCSLLLLIGENMSTSVGVIQRIKEHYATWQHALFWLGIFVNFLVFYLVISSLSYVGWVMPVVQGAYLAMCFKAYAKGSNAMYIIIPLFVVSGALYMSLSSVV